jgi:hypothetical protein
MSPLSATCSVGGGGGGGGGAILGPNPAPNPMASAPKVRHRKRRPREPIVRRNHATTRSRRVRLDMLSLLCCWANDEGRRGSQQRSEQWRRYFRAMSARGDWSCARACTSSGKPSWAVGVCRAEIRDALDEASSVVADGSDSVGTQLATSAMPSNLTGTAEAGSARTNARQATRSRTRRIHWRCRPLINSSVVRQPGRAVSGPFARRRPSPLRPSALEGLVETSATRPSTEAGQAHTVFRRSATRATSVINTFAITLRIASSMITPSLPIALLGTGTAAHAPGTMSVFV